MTPETWEGGPTWEHQMPHGVICLISGPGALVSEILVSLLLAVYSQPDRFQTSGEARAPC